MKYLIALASLFYVFHLLNINSGRVCVDRRTVAEVGGCDRHECGVKFVDGSFGEMSHPVVGRSICYDYQRSHPWKWK